MRINHFLLFVLLGIVFFQCKYAIQGTPLHSTKDISVDHAAVVTAHPEASKIGVDILKKGGNAIDASIAVQFALSVCYPVAGNIGGGGFMVYRDKNGESITLDYREKAPLKATEKMYQDKDGNVIPNLSTLGHLAVGVPGTVAGMYMAFDSLSALKDWKALIQPSIDLAQKGFILTEQQANYLNHKKDGFAKANTTENMFNTDKMYKKGDRFLQKNLAKTLTAIRDYGQDGFYKGWVADAIVDDMKKNGGIITHADLEAYTANWLTPIVTPYKDYKVISMPPPSSGGIVLTQLLHSVAPYDIKKWGFHDPRTMHLFIEAEKRAYADRAHHIGDMNFYDVPVKMLTDKDYVTERMSNFDLEKATDPSTISHGNFKESEQTTHYCIVDKEGNAVSMTTTLNAAYGSKVVVPKAGFLLNNEMDDFSSKPGVANIYGLVGAEANKIEPEKRMLSSMTPTIVEKNNELFLVVGTPGGSTIITSVFQVMMNVMEFDMPVKEAVQAPRFHHQWKPESVYYESGIWEIPNFGELEKYGHKLKQRSPIGRVEAILVKDGKIHAGADNRGDDDAQGY